MKNILARENAGVLSQIASSRVLLAFDFDGTLAPIVEDRDRAFMRQETQRLFADVCALYPAAVLSGRGQRDVAARLGEAGVKYVIGNHGIEPCDLLDDFESEVKQVCPLLEGILRACSGIDIEDKRYSLAIHYRRSRSKRDARTAIEQAVAALPVRMRLIPGKLVINIVPERAPNKGDALLRLRAIQRADAALYVGDDVTDEDVFHLDQLGRLLTIRVGMSRSSAATYFVRDQRAMDGLLARLAALGEARARSGEGNTTPR